MGCSIRMAPMQAMRRERLLEQANQQDHGAIRRLAAVRADLHDQQSALRQQRDAQATLKNQLTAKSATLQTQLAVAAKTRDGLAAKLQAEQAAAAQAELA